MLEKSLDLADLTAPLLEALEYWRARGGETLGCGWDDFELIDLPPVLIPTTLVVDVMADVTKNRFRFWGTGMVAIHGVDLTGLTTSALEPEELRKAVQKNHADTIADAAASASIYGFQRHGGFDHHQNILRLPLSDDGRSVSHIVAIIDLTDEGRAFFYAQQKNLSG